MRKSASRGNTNVMSVGRLDERSISLRRLGAALLAHRGSDQPREQRMRARRTRLQLGMELTADEPWMIGELDDLDERAVRAHPTQSEPVLDERVPILVRYFIAVAVPLADLGHAVHLGRLAAAREPTRVRSQPHRAAHVGDVLLGFHQADHRVLALRRELARMTVVELEHVARELDDRHLHPETDTEE